MFFSSAQPPLAPFQRPNRFALITGAAAGIGRAFAQALAARAQPLLLVDRHEELLTQVATTLKNGSGLRVLVLSEDLSSPEGPQRVFEFCGENEIEVDLLINNAAVGFHAALEDQPLERIDEMVQVNVLSVVKLTQLFLPGMKQRGHGTILNVSSAGVYDHCPLWTVYAATKAFVLHFTESLQDEVAGSGVNVVALCPGMTKTTFFEEAGHKVPPDEQLQTPEEVVAEALRGLDHHQPLIVTGWANRMRVHAQRATLRRLFSGVKRGLRRVAMLS